MKNTPFWLDTLDPPQLASLTGQLSALPSSVDVVVIGGGYTGLAAARRLAIEGASVLVLERGDLASGASSRNGGQVLAGLKLDAATLVSRYGERRACELFDLGGRAVEDLEAMIAAESIECDYERTGHVAAAAKPSHFAALRAEQALLARVFNHHVELVPRDRQRSELGSDAWHGLAVDEASRAINPAKYAAGLAAAARRRGACLASNVTVGELRREGGRWRVGTTDEDVLARDILVATNGYTTAATPAIRRRIVPIGSYIIVTEPLRPGDAQSILPKRRVAFDTRHFLVYFRLTPDNRLLFGGRAAFSEPTSASAQRATETLRRSLASMFPQLAGTSIAYAWHGHVAFTRDQMPHAGMIDDMYFAGGYCGHGVAMATHLGDAIACRMAGHSAPHPLMRDPMPAIPLYAGRPWFLPAVGAYYKVMDWLT